MTRHQPTHSTHCQTLGLMGEQLVLSTLKQTGYLILDVHWRYSNKAEIDVIACLTEPFSLHFIEVKTRTSDLSTAFESWSPTKQHRMKQAALAYLQTLEPCFKTLGYSLILSWFTNLPLKVSLL